MIDFHAHILPDTDDGAVDIIQTRKMLEEARMAGFTDIIATSHYKKEVFELNEISRQNRINIIEKIDNKVKLHIGSEIYITKDLVNLIKDKKASSINNTRYVLFELPFRDNLLIFNSVIDDLKRNKLVPILAHPERYEIVKNNPKIVEDWIKRGIYMQANYLSILDKYGKEARKVLEILLKHNLIHFLGSDAHRPDNTYPKIAEATEKIKKIIGEDNFYKLSEENPRKVLNNEKIEFLQTTEIKQSIFNKFK